MSFLVETLADGVLWDSDYELQQTLDIPRETSQELKDHLGIDDDYFKVIPLNPLDDQIMLYLDALIGLTVEAVLIRFDNGVAAS